MGSVGETGTAAASACLGSNLLISGAMSQIWGMINGLQLFVHIPLFNVQFPEIAGVVVEKLTMIATFDLIPTDDLYENTFDLPEEEEVSYLDERAKERLEDGGYESSFLISNLGTLFITFLIILTVPLCVFASRPCIGKSPWIKRKHTSTLAAMRGNLWIRYLMEASLDVSISGTINLIVDIENSKVPMSSTFDVINSISLILIYTVNLAFPVIILVFYARNYSRWTKPDFDKKYGAIFTGLRKDRKSSLLYPFVFCFRRIVLTIVVILASKYLFLQLIS